MKFYELVVKALKKEFYTASTTSADSHPAQNTRNLAVSCKAFVSFFRRKSLSLFRNLQTNIDIVS